MNYVEIKYSGEIVRRYPLGSGRARYEWRGREFNDLSVFDAIDREQRHERRKVSGNSQIAELVTKRYSG